ncbi:Na(+)/H(+) antiporter subunit C [Schaalia hyovaginalis]|uniref:Na(+)/H(+) antiporter subunit C n=1 Tax=Schaalia hyovaginalis TaxID=29316 RepID=UPI0026F228A3|nr:Na(+)/H(+) antiporter subunit C [Schaalia hyovaginalis]MCI6556245.1 Na(+)/H(+) antiporter subunit C [Schaalia hyovaginalis]MDD7554984.1 Na(+)/H(+) antiporter subunit C [Schaalia hyovaginalis]MDY3093615.1 Na(+)/H(+) antiporter subunit C [Schaalia hyovaginalis]
MTSSLSLILLAAFLVAAGVYLVLERSLSRIVLGLTLLTNGLNIVFLIAGGPSGAPPLVGAAEPEAMADPLVQAMMLTAIVIGLGTSGFLMTLAYRTWQLNGNDEVQDDLEDRRVARRVERARLEARREAEADIEVEARLARDETEGEDEDFEDAPTSAPADVLRSGAPGDEGGADNGGPSNEAPGGAGGSAG